MRFWGRGCRRTWPGRGDDQREHKLRVDGQHGQGFGQGGVGDEGHDEQQRAEREIEQIAQQDAVAAQVGDEHEGQDNDAAFCENGREEHQKDHAADVQRERTGACEHAQHEHTEREGEENVVVDGQHRVGSNQVVNGVAGRRDGRLDEQTQDIALAVVGVAEAVDREKGEEYTDTAGQNVENTGKLDGEQTGDVVDVIKDHENGHKQFELECIVLWQHVEKSFSCFLQLDHCSKFGRLGQLGQINLKES